MSNPVENSYFLKVNLSISFEQNSSPFSHIQRKRKGKKPKVIAFLLFHPSTYYFLSFIIFIFISIQNSKVFLFIFMICKVIENITKGGNKNMKDHIFQQRIWNLSKIICENTAKKVKSFSFENGKWIWNVRKIMRLQRWDVKK